MTELKNNSRIRLHFQNENLWSQATYSHALGYVFCNGHLFDAQALSKLFDAQNSFENFVLLLRQLNGFFSCIRVEKESVFLAVDHLRSRPLFYATLEKNVFASDDAHWVRGQIHDEGVDELSVKEMLLTRSVSGINTLSPFVKRLQAGEAVALKLTPSEVLRNSERYYLTRHCDVAEQTFNQLTLRADMALLAAFRRLAEYSHGRTVVVPLGGGLDSRLVLLMLKRIGYDNVVSFTYGRPGNKESRISKQVALELHIPWYFIPYSNSDWRRWYNSSDWLRYCRFANGLSCTPHLQDWPAVLELKEKGLIPNDSVFAPGHTAIMNLENDANLQLLAEWLRMGKISDDELARGLSQVSCTLLDRSHQPATVRSDVCLKIKDVLGLPSTLTAEQAIEYFDRWIWEAIPTYPHVNSVRVYEFWGYRWWLPLLDMEFVRFLNTLPFNFRVNRRFHLSYVRTLEHKFTGKAPIADTSSRKSIAPLLARVLDKLRLRTAARRIRARVEYSRHAYAWYGLITESEYHRTFHGQENINTYLANQTIKQVFPLWEIPTELDFLAERRH